MRRRPEAAVAELIQGIADLDGPAIVGVVAPAEVADADRADAAYARLQDRVVRIGEVPPVEVDRVLAAAEDQLSGSFSRSSIAVLSAVDLDLSALDLRTQQVDESTARVYLFGGDLALTVDPSRLPDGAVVDGGISTGAAGYDMALAEGWRRGREEIVAYLVAVEVEGRWFVSLEASADDLRRGRRDSPGRRGAEVSSSRRPATTDAGASSSAPPCGPAPRSPGPWRCWCRGFAPGALSHVSPLEVGGALRTGVLGIPAAAGFVVLLLPLARGCCWRWRPPAAAPRSSYGWCCGCSPRRLPGCCCSDGVGVGRHVRRGRGAGRRGVPARSGGAGLQHRPDAGDRLGRTTRTRWAARRGAG